MDERECEHMAGRITKLEDGYEVLDRRVDVTETKIEVGNTVFGQIHATMTNIDKKLTEHIILEDKMLRGIGAKIITVLFGIVISLVVLVFTVYHGG